MAEILASGTTETSSSTFTVTAGTPVTVFLKVASGALVPRGSRAVVQIQESGTNWLTVIELTRQRSQVVIDAPGTYRVTRLAAGTAFGIDKV